MDKIYKEQNETIIALQKEVDKLKKELQAEREVNVGHRNQNNVISNWLVDYKKEVDELKEENKLLREQLKENYQKGFEHGYNNGKEDAKINNQIK